METSTSVVPASAEGNVQEATPPSPEEKMFELRFEHYPNKDIVTIHTRKKFFKFSSEHGMDMEKKPSDPFLKSLLRVKGVVAIGTRNYELRVTKGKVFSWEELKPIILGLMEKHFTDGLKIKELPASFPSPEYLAQCLQQGCDIRDI